MVENDNSDYKKVITANQKLHTVLASAYNETEPHFKPENIAHVDRQLRKVFGATNSTPSSRPRLWNRLYHQHRKEICERDRRR